MIEKNNSPLENSPEEKSQQAKQSARLSAKPQSSEPRSGKPQPDKVQQSKTQQSKTKPTKPQPRKQRIEFGFDINPDWFSKIPVYLLIAFLLLPALFSFFRGDVREEIPINQMVGDVRSERIQKIEVMGDELRLFYDDETQKTAYKEPGQQVVEILNSASIDLEAVGLQVENVSMSKILWDLFLSIFPLVLLFIFFFFLFRQTRGGQSGIMGIGKSKAKLFVKGKQTTKFADVGGMDEAKQELEEIVDFLKHPKKYRRVGARTPKGVLLVGPAGTGKTLLARAVAGEANVQFLSIAGSEFMEMLVGVGASRVRDLFLTAKRLAPSIIFIDEIDAIGRIRGHGSFGGHDEREQTLNQILVEMDGFTPNDNVIVMAATNRGDMLDPALVRPGRFDRRVMVRLPDLEERKYILSIHAQGKPADKKLDWDKVARRTVGFSGADIENMLNEAAIAVAREERNHITMSDIEEASLKVKLGPSKKQLQNKEERSMTAYHEAGHAVIAHVSKHADPVHRISIVSRGQALGFTLTPPERDKFQTTKSELIDRIAVLLGGRSAEQIIFNEQTAGASSDIERATRIARAMVMEYGMSKLGAMNYAPLHETDDYGKAWGDALRISDRLQEKVDAEIGSLIAEGEKKAHEILIKYRGQLDAVSERLLEIETLDSDEFTKIMGFDKAKVVGSDVDKDPKSKTVAVAE